VPYIKGAEGPVWSPDGLLVVDYGVAARSGETTAPLAVPLERLNQLLADLGQAPLAEQDY